MVSVPSLLVVIPVWGVDGALERAVRSAGGVGVEVVVVDDGSEPPIEALPPARVLRIEHGGVSRARNAGAADGQGDVLVFLDADDELLPGWQERLAVPFDGDDVACVCGAAEQVDPDGHTTTRQPGPLGPAFAGVDGLFLAGSFAVRRSVFDAVGGYDEAIAFSENTELALRLTRWCDANRRRVVAVPVPVVRIHRRDRLQRRARYAEARLAAVERLFAQHGEAIARDDALAADYARVAGAAAAHLGRYSSARGWFRRSKEPADLARAALTLVPVARTRVWGSADA